MRQNREVVRRINGRGRENVLLQPLASEPKVAASTMSANERQIVDSALEFRARIHGCQGLS